MWEVIQQGKPEQPQGTVEKTTEMFIHSLIIDSVHYAFRYMVLDIGGEDIYLGEVDEELRTRRPKGIIFIVDHNARLEEEISSQRIEEHHRHIYAILGPLSNSKYSRCKTILFLINKNGTWCPEIIIFKAWEGHYGVAFNWVLPESILDSINSSGLVFSNLFTERFNLAEKELLSDYFGLQDVYSSFLKNNTHITRQDNNNFIIDKINGISLFFELSLLFCRQKKQDALLPCCFYSNAPREDAIALNTAAELNRKDIAELKPKKEENGDTSAAVGLFGGAVLGAAVGGPIGAIIGGIFGSMFGKSAKGVG